MIEMKAEKRGSRVCLFANSDIKTQDGKKVVARFVAQPVQFIVETNASRVSEPFMEMPIDNARRMFKQILRDIGD